MNHALAETVAGQFAVDGPLVAVEPFAGGHIHDSYVATCDSPTVVRRFLLQRINTAIFRDPPRLMDNIVRVTRHIAARLRSQGIADVERRVLTVIPAADGRPFVPAPDGSYWRMYRFIERTRVHEAVQTPAQAECAGRAFGDLQRLLADFPVGELHETIPDFHNTPLRLAALERAIAADVCSRVREAQREIELVRQHRDLAPVLVNLLQTGVLPLRVVHNDAKLSNVLLDDGTGEGLCVVDLDIVMPGTALYDFGDMVRSMTTTAAEDEPDASKVALSPSLFAALARGYLAAASAFLTPPEHGHLVFAGQLITLEQAIRFLTDFLTGDTYYKTSRPNHNLDRTRTQLKRRADLTRREAELSRLIRLLAQDTSPRSVAPPWAT